MGVTLKGTFKVNKWKWYLVDVRDYHKPVIVRKHLDSKEQAKKFKERHYDNDFEIILGKEALRYGLKDFINYKPGNRHKSNTTKYNYPDHVVTDKEKEIYRHNLKRAMQQNKRKPKITSLILTEILEDNFTLFFLRLKKRRAWHWIFSKPFYGICSFEDKYKWPYHIKYLINIIKILKKYYDYGFYDPIDVTIYIYERWKKKIQSWDTLEANPTKKWKIKREFLARGFIEKSQSGFKESDSFVETIWIKPILVYPELCWHAGKDMEKYDHLVYDLQRLIGIPGFTSAHVAGLKRRK